MRDKRKFCRPKITNHPHAGDIVVKLKCGKNAVISYENYYPIENFFKIESFVGSSSNKIGNIVALNTDYNKLEIFDPKTFDLVKDKFTIKNIIGEKSEPEEGDIIAYNSILEQSAVFKFSDFENIDLSWNIISIEGVDTHSKSQAVVGDILIQAYNSNLIINSNDYSKVSSNWDVIGIIAIESRNTPDKKLRILSLDYMDYNNPTSGNSGTGISMMWGADGNINGVLDLNQVPCMSNSNDNVLTEDIQRAIDYSFIPTDYFTGTQSSTEGYKYWSSLESSYAGRYCPPAYLNDGSLNPQFIAKEATIPGTTTKFSINNALSDFNGLLNTQNIMKLCTVDTPTNSAGAGNYPAAQCCSMYSKGGLDWYLPASGELACVVSNFKTINSSRTNVGYAGYNYSGYWFWSSTPHSSSNARHVSGGSGGCYGNGRSNADSGNRVLAVAAF